MLKYRKKQKGYSVPPPNLTTVFWLNLEMKYLLPNLKREIFKGIIKHFKKGFNY